MSRKGIKRNRPDDVNRICTTCLILKEICEFHLTSKHFNKKLNVWRYYRHQTCNTCRNDKLRDYKNQWAREHNRVAQLRIYGLTITSYEKLLVDQNRACKLCLIQEKDYGRNFHIDHCHRTGKVRGLLCHKCNQGLGLFNDNIVLLIKASQYLQASQGPL